MIRQVRSGGKLRPQRQRKEKQETTRKPENTNLKHHFGLSSPVPSPHTAEDHSFPLQTQEVRKVSSQVTLVRKQSDMFPAKRDLVTTSQTQSIGRCELSGFLPRASFVCGNCVNVSI